MSLKSGWPKKVIAYLEGVAETTTFAEVAQAVVGVLDAPSLTHGETAKIIDVIRRAGFRKQTIWVRMESADAIAG